MDRVRRDSIMRALDLHTLVNDFRSKMGVEGDPLKRAQLKLLTAHWEAKAKEAEGPVRPLGRLPVIDGRPLKVSG